MHPVCQAERAAARCEPPEQRTVDGRDEGASDDGSTREAKK